MIGVVSRGILKIPYLTVFLKSAVKKIYPSKQIDSDVIALAGWALRPTTKKIRQLAKKKSLPYVSLEDGFLRSFGAGSGFPPLSIVLDRTGIYYDSTNESDIERALNSDSLEFGLSALEIDRVIKEIQVNQLSKYNHAPLINLERYKLDLNREKVLVVDQTAGDMSIKYGSADDSTFKQMLNAARKENPNALIYIKTHPEVSSGKKAGYFSDLKDDENTVLVREAVNPLSLIEKMTRVYVVTSTMGFEAVLSGKPVSVFGLPWYAGWGVTDDRQVCARRTKTRTVSELFGAAYLNYARYINPETKKLGTIFDVMLWLVLQKKMAHLYSGLMVCVGFRRWKAANIKAMLSLFPERVKFVKDANEARQLNLTENDCLIHWGRNAPEGLVALSQERHVRLLRMEDGFVRSVGLGSDLIKPQSLVLDASGIYFDPTQESDLERILNDTTFSEEMIQRAQNVRATIVDNQISKYNTESRDPVTWTFGDKKVILVPGQVEDDASIKFGCEQVNTNLGLLQITRKKEPNAFIVYKPHPDVMASNRIGKVGLEAASQFADYIETHASITSCLAACHEVHTMTSLTGFDALLRGKKVVVYGKPFYSGWGLTEDALTVPRRVRKLTLDELVAGALLEYPVYWDWNLKGYTTCEAVLNNIIREREILEKSGRLTKLKVGYLRRQFRKATILIQAWLK